MKGLEKLSLQYIIPSIYNDVESEQEKAKRLKAHFHKCKDKAQFKFQHKKY